MSVSCGLAACRCLPVGRSVHGGALAGKAIEAASTRLTSGATGSPGFHDDTDRIPQRHRVAIPAASGGAAVWILMGWNRAPRAGSGQAADAIRANRYVSTPGAPHRLNWLPAIP